MNATSMDGQWLDFYALLEVPVNADEATISKSIRRVFAEATANSDHRDLKLRHYYQSLAEQVLPQARRVLLDPEWRAKYDRQHILHSINDPSAQDYVAFITTMRGGEKALSAETVLPQRVQEEINVARQVVETASAGRELELLPSRTVVGKVDNSFEVQAIEEAVAQESPAQSLQNIPATQPIPAPTVQAKTPPARKAPIQAAPVEPTQAIAAPTSQAPAEATPALSEEEEEAVQQRGEPVFAKILTAQEAADLRRQRARTGSASSTATNKLSTTPTPVAKTIRADVIGGDVVLPQRRKGKVGANSTSRVVVGEANPNRAHRGQRLISPTSLNLMVAITGVLLTITIQRFASPPAIATSSSRMPLIVAASPALAEVLTEAENGWEKTPDGASFDVVVQTVDSPAGLSRALGRDGDMPDVWIPSNSLWATRYNELAKAAGREKIEVGEPLAQTPLVLISRANKSGELRRRFPNHQITSWSALHDVVVNSSQSKERFGMTDPQQTASGAIVRYSMAREWASNNNTTTQAAIKDNRFWSWMRGFENNVAADYSTNEKLMKELTIGATDRVWWAIGYESDAVQAMDAGTALDIYYLPRTWVADHPFCDVKRLGAPVEITSARASFEKYLRSKTIQKALLQSGLRPDEISPTANISNNPFNNSNFAKHGIRVGDLPRDERINFETMSSLTKTWQKRMAD